jgi:hypothetical protein
MAVEKMRRCLRRTRRPLARAHPRLKRRHFQR